MHTKIRCLYILLIIAGFFLPGARAQVMFPTYLSEDSVLSRKRLIPVLYYSNPDKAFAGVRLRLARGRLGKNPYGFDQSVQLRYSISQNSFSTLYNGNFYDVVGKWNISVNAYYDWLIWTNFFGFGNDTRKDSTLTYYRLSTSEYALNVGLNRVIRNKHYLEAVANLQGVEVFSRPNTLVADSFISNRSYYFEHHTYASITGAYAYQDVDDHVLPTKGVFLYAGAGYTLNTYQTAKSFGKYTGIAQVYIPLVDKFSLAVRVGGSAISGNPEFYQYVTAGGPITIRGYTRDRFWGNATLYNSNELRYITSLRVKKYNNKVGLLVLFDDGRVWARNENSTTIHYGYGGGILASPANKFTFYATYTQSQEGGLVQFKVSKLLNKVPAGGRQTRY